MMPRFATSMSPHQFPVPVHIRSLVFLLLLLGQLHQNATAFQIHSKNARADSAKAPTRICERRILSRYPASHRSKKQGFDDTTAASSAAAATIYKDDCFGLATFVAGVAMQDYAFAAIFVCLSLAADVLTRLDVLPPDPKRPQIVDRRVPGAIAILTLLLTFGFADVMGDETVVVDGSATDGNNMARMVQLAICLFSIVTAFLDIRWRDRFDYPSEDSL